MTHSDGFFVMGKSHTVCQDYVRTGVTSDGRSYVIVSDGCSSSKDTDIGARFLVRAAENYICNGFAINIPAIVEHAKSAVHAMYLPRTCLDATLMIAVDDGSNNINVHMIGDGVVACRRRDGNDPFIFQVEYPSGAPFYPNYYLDPQRLKAFYAMPDHDFVESCSLDSIKLKEPVLVPEPITPPNFQFYTEQDHIIWFQLPKADYDLVTLMTDGAVSFRKDPAVVIPVPDIVKQVLDVKVPTGEFMVRRGKKFLSFCTQQGWSHYDDFSVGAIFVDEPAQDKP